MPKFSAVTQLPHALNPLLRLNYLLASDGSIFREANVVTNVLLRKAEVNVVFSVKASCKRAPVFPWCQE
jgi:hypothetical protein